MPKPITNVSFNAARIYTKVLEKFRGVDLTSAAVNVEDSRSSDAPNMMPDLDGFPVKRPGFEIIRDFGARINGSYAYQMGNLTKRLIHAGTRLYERTGEGYRQIATMANAKSRAWQLAGKLWIIDGVDFRYYDGYDVGYVRDIATVPVITISKAPNGEDGATSYKPINLLTGWRTDSYLGTAEDLVYYLSFNGLHTDGPGVEMLDDEGNWVEGEWSNNAGSITLTRGGESVTITYTFNAAVGKVTFSSAPGESPVTGEDNVRITYNGNSGEDKIARMTVGTLYGVNGALDRLFLAGDPENPSTDRWSEWNDPTYYGDTFYGSIGTEGSPIMGYSVIGDTLVTHKQSEENGRNAFVRTGSLDEDGFALFRIVNVIQGDGVISKESVKSFRGEPVFLTRQGIYALTPSDITGERYATLRSYYLNGKLLKCEDLAESSACVWGRFYVLSAGRRLWMLDGNQKAYEAKSPNSGYQYEGYYFTGINACELWEEDGALWFGTEEGKLCRLMQAGKREHYTDPTGPVEAYWTTPISALGTWSNVKNIKGVWVVAQPFARSSGEILFATDRLMEYKVKEYEMDIFDFNDIDFGRFTFNALDRAQSVSGGKKAKKVKVFQVKVRNARSEPFGIAGITIRYTTGGKIK